MHYKKHTVNCPYCQKPIHMFLDASVMRGRHVEECLSCKHSVEVKYEVKDGEFVNVAPQEFEK